LVRQPWRYRYALCHQNSPPTIEGLLRAGADVNIANKLGTTPLMLASYLGVRDMVRVLVEKHASINPKMCSGQ